MAKLFRIRILAPTVILLTLSGCLGGFLKPNYSTLEVHSIEETYDGIRIRIQNMSDRYEAKVLNITLTAKNGAGEILGESSPDSLNHDDTWFQGGKVEVGPDGPIHFIPPNSIVEGWAFAGKDGITHLEVLMVWEDSRIESRYLDEFEIPYYHESLQEPIDEDN